MEVIVQRGYTSCLFNVSLYGSYCTKGVHILLGLRFLNMEVIVQRGYTSCLFNVSLYGSYCTKGVHILLMFNGSLIRKLLYKGGTHLVCSLFPYMEVIVQRGYTSC